MTRLILFLMMSVLATAGTSQAEDLSPCDADQVPIQIMGGLKDGPVTTLSKGLEFEDYRPFSTFVTTVTEHLVAKLAQENLCPNREVIWDLSLIKFAHIYYNAAEDDTARSLLPPLQVRPSGVCRISSPWIDLAIGRQPILRVRAIVRFNERQIVADQAVLAGVRNVPPGVAMPLTPSEFGRYAHEYIRDARQGKQENNSPKPIMDNPIEERVPPDLLWLFRQGSGRSGRSGGSGGSGILPYSVYAGEFMKKVTEKGAEGYTNLVISLIDQCFASDGAEIHYDSILDIDDPELLEQYKIATPLR